MPISHDLTRKGAYWLVSVASSVAIVAASMVFIVETSRSFFGPPAAAAAVAGERPVRVADVVSAPNGDLPTPAPAITTNGPPPPVKAAAPAVAAVAAPPVAAPAAVPPSPTMTVSTRTGLNVRAEPRSGSARIGTLDGGTAVTVLDTQGAWTHIATDTIDGWVFSKYLS
jgi:uncharacterized protein YgiM (DUF1202 family)